jgi:dihydroxy-acid dehydratase
MFCCSAPADSEEKDKECLAAGNAIKLLMERDIKPSDIMTASAFRNAMVVIMATGGSTNAVLHLIAMARAIDVPLTIDDFQEVQ